MPCARSMARARARGGRAANEFGEVIGQPNEYWTIRLSPPASYDRCAGLASPFAPLDVAIPGHPRPSPPRPPSLFYLGACGDGLRVRPSPAAPPRRLLLQCRPHRRKPAGRIPAV
eukprot:scaffold8935_cov69-Phaeocystis_antarctica.AAC.6